MCHGQGDRIWAPEGNLGDECRGLPLRPATALAPTRLRYGNSAREFDKISKYALLCGSRCCRQAPSEGPGMGLRPGLPLAQQPGADLPERNRRRSQAEPALAGSGRTAPVKDVGEPCAGEPNARFDGRGWKRSRHYRASPSPNQPPTLVAHPLGTRASGQ